MIIVVLAPCSRALGAWHNEGALLAAVPQLVLLSLSMARI